MNTLKTVLYMGSMHGFFTFYLPYQLALTDRPFYNLGVFRYFAFLPWLIGILMIAWCSLDFIRKGHGTPAHLDPPKTLIISGWYRYVRNPIYGGALLVQLGYILWFASHFIILYFLSAFLAFNMLVVLIEEPILKLTFGVRYDEYVKRVPRWIPRFTPYYWIR
jgi:protein-S-isoprenylcysteine O-methyltransferase Ste14